MENDKRYISIEEAAELLGCSPSNIRYYTNKGVLQRFKGNGNGVWFEKEHILNMKDVLKSNANVRKNVETLLGKSEINNKLFNELCRVEDSLRAEIEECRKDLRVLEISDKYYKLPNPIITILGKYANLKDHEIKVLMLFNEGCTTAEVAERMYLTRERIRQIVCKTMHKFSECNIIEERKEYLAVKSENAILKAQLEELREENLRLSHAVLKSTEIPCDVTLYNLYHDCQNRKLRSEGLSVRVVNACSTHNIKTVADFLSIDSKVFYDFSNIGYKCKIEVEDWMDAHGYSWGMFKELKELDNDRGN